MTGERNKSMRKTLSTENFKIHVFGTDDNSFNVTAVILQKEADAYLINTVFTRATANELVDFLNTEKLNLKGAFAIHGDPDYYFGIEQILRSVPKLDVLSTEETQQHIAESVIGKLAVWSSVLQEQAPSRSEELATSLKTAYPDYINTGVIDLGAKVLLGEIQWG